MMSEPNASKLSAITCRNLPLSQFVSALVDGEFGEMDADTWLDVYSEYCTLIGGVQITSMIRNARAMMQLQSKIGRIMAMVNALRLMYMPEVAAELKNAGYVLNFIPGNEFDYAQQLNVIEAQLAPELLRLRQLENELPKEQGKKPTHEDFELTLMEASKFEGYPISENITVHKYTMYVQRLRNHIEALKKTAKDGRRADK